MLSSIFRRRTVVGIYNVPRSGSNFLAACLHYHPSLFAVSEGELNWRRPLFSLWRRRSILKTHGRQRKSLGDVSHVVFNKVQRSPMWQPGRRFPAGTRFIFHLRNPIRIQLSRESYRQEFDPGRQEWNASLESFDKLLAEMRLVLDAHAAISRQHATMLLSHEYFCTEHSSALAEVFHFLGLRPAKTVDTAAFYQTCGSCGGRFESRPIDGARWLQCNSCATVLKGYGNFNPLREIDANDLKSETWKQHPQIGELMQRVRQALGDPIADYYWHGRYDENVSFSSRLAA